MPGTTSAKRARISRTARNAKDKSTSNPQELWADLRAAKTEEAAKRARDQVIERYLPLVEFHAHRLHSRLPRQVDVQDLISVGFFGLLNAIDNFDLDRGVKFETYCAQRIRGAILDELRLMDWTPRNVRSRSALMRQAENALSLTLGRPPTRDEIAAWLGVGSEEYARIERDSKQTSIISMHRNWNDADDSKQLGEIDVLQDDSQTDPLLEVQKRDLRDFVLRGFSRIERLILTLYYFEQMTMKEIGLTLALSESRVSQLHASILRRLRAKMQHRPRELGVEDDPDATPALV